MDSKTKINGKGIYTNMTCDAKHPEFNPTNHQTNVLNYFLNSQFRGLLLYHKLGSGKTCTSIMIADEMLRQGKIEHVFVLSPGSLRSNWIFEYCNKCGFDSKYLSANFTFVTYNYGLIKNNLRYINFDNSLVIIDEIHKFIRGTLNVESIKKNGDTSYSAIFELYKKIMTSTNVKVLGLSGTPIFQGTYEWSLLGNLLRGNKDMFNFVIRKSELGLHDHIKSIISKQQFTYSMNTSIWKDEDILDRHMQGIISYYPGDLTQYPSVSNYIIVCPMSDLHYRQYINIRNRENILRGTKPVKNMKDINKYLTDMAMYIMALKWIRTRCISNFYYPDEFIQLPDVLTTQKMQVYVNENVEIDDNDEDKEIEKNVDYITQVQLSTDEDGNLIENQVEEKVEEKQLIYTKQKVRMYGWVTDPREKDYSRQQDVLFNRALVGYSGKFTALLTNITCNLGTKHAIYTFFKKKGGVRLISTLLSRCGITNAIFSGDITDKQRNDILNTFNNPNNRDGEIIKVLLLTEAGEEGITLKEVNNMHILESATVHSKISQAIGRVVRMRSHTDMPENRRYVNIYRYWSTSPGTSYAVYDADKDTIPTFENSIDSELFNMGRNMEKNNIEPFLQRLIRNSIENNVVE